MNHVTITQASDQLDYILKENDQTVLKLHYKNDGHVVRIETDKERRVLIVNDEGLLRTRMVLKNEYGVPIGSLTYDNFSHNQGSVEIENLRYRFVVRENAVPELNIYKGSRRNLVYTCQLLFDDRRSGRAKSQTASFIIALSWYLVSKENAHANQLFNEAIIS